MQQHRDCLTGRSVPVMHDRIRSNHTTCYRAYSRLLWASNAVCWPQYINKYARLEVALQLVRVEQQLLIEFIHACSLTIDELRRYILCRLFLRVL